MFNKKSKERIQALEKENSELKELLAIKRGVLFLLEDTIPKEQNERRKYVGDIALFYSTIFKEKLKHFKGEQMIELSKFGRSEEVNNILRANINCFELIDEWMDKKTKEHFGDLEEIRNNFQNDEDFIDNIRKTYES